MNESKPTPTTDEVLATGSIEMERRAELTLLNLTINKSKKEVNRILSELGITRPEYERLVEKYSRVIDRYKKENKNE